LQALVTKALMRAKLPETYLHKETTMKTNSVTLHRIFSTTPEKLFRAFTDPDAFARWLPPKGFTAKVSSMDVKAGGTYAMSFTNFTTGNSHSFSGTYLELRENEYLCYTSIFDDPNMSGEIRTTITLKAVSSGTEFTAVQEGIPEFIPADACNLGWQESLVFLAMLVEPDIQE
jgi:uncharacterized protein YndB with AHSA1/START domain